MRTVAAANLGCFAQVGKTTLKVGRLACCDESCVALLRLDRSSQRVCIDLSVISVALGRHRQRATGIALVQQTVACSYLPATATTGKSKQSNADQHA
jgi:hypothetical protein